MTRANLFFLFTLLLTLNVSAQQSLTVSRFEPTSERWLLLTKDRKFISNNDSLNEELVDLVQVFVVDSVLPSKSQRHRVAAAGWVISILGYKWKALNMTKQKFVGTERDGIRVPGHGPRFTEYDVNFNLIPHTRRYIDMLWPAYVQQRDRNRFGRIKNFGEAPWIYPETLEHINRYRNHCEITPPQKFLPMLNQKFYPCVQPNSSKDHPNIGTDFATFGLYGAYVADYNHTGHAEIHPYEWLWWYDLHPDRLDQTRQTWFFGLMEEASNRFRGWYKKNPRTGAISIPFVFDLKNDTFKITLEHLVHDIFNEEDFKKLANMPSTADNLYFSDRKHAFENEELKDKTVLFHTSNPIRTEGLKYWFSKLNVDKEKNLLTGFLNVGVSVEELYNAKVTFE